MSKKTDSNPYEKVINMKKVPILPLDNRWHQLFPNNSKPQRIKHLEQDVMNLLKKEKILSNIILLDKFLIKGLIDDNRNFNLHIKVDEQENILGIDYNLEKIINKK